MQIQTHYIMVMNINITYQIVPQHYRVESGQHTPQEPPLQQEQEKLEITTYL